jgi:hypothetical protein
MCLFNEKSLALPKGDESKTRGSKKSIERKVINGIKIDIWHPVHINKLSEEEKELIIPQIINYLEKYKLDAMFDKFKVRVLARGNKQVYTGESEGPVA